MIPACPRCGSTNGMLGTSNAYFICHNPECWPEHDWDRSRPSHEVYFLGDGRHPQDQGLTWKDAVLASPWGRDGSGAHYFEEKA